MVLCCAQSPAMWQMIGKKELSDDDIEHSEERVGVGGTLFLGEVSARVTGVVGR